MRYAREIIFTGIIHLQRLLFQSLARFHAIRVIKCYMGLNRFGENCVCEGGRVQVLFPYFIILLFSAVRKTHHPHKTKTFAILWGYTNNTIFVKLVVD